jgi:hypothetical protein
MKTNKTSPGYVAAKGSAAAIPELDSLDKKRKKMLSFAHSFFWVCNSKNGFVQ